MYLFRLFNHILSLIQTSEYAYSIIIFCLFKHLKSPAELSPSSGRTGCFVELTFLAGDEDAALGRGLIYLLTIEIIDNLFLILLMKGRRGDGCCTRSNGEADGMLAQCQIILVVLTNHLFWQPGSVSCLALSLSSSVGAVLYFVYKSRLTLASSFIFQCHLPKWQKTQKDCQRSGEKYHQKAYYQPGNYDRNKLSRIYKQSESEEHYQLKKPSQAFKKLHRRTLVYKLGIADYQSSDIYCKIAVALQKIG